MREEDREEDEDAGRRSFLSSATAWFMAGGLAAGYGACAAMGARYLFPPRPRPRSWVFVARADELAVGDSLDYRAPTGERVAITRRSDTGGAHDFIALSSTCPHLGCQVHWEAANNRFFCPCHNGAFDPAGNPIAGPPAEAGQSLPRFDLDVREGLLYIEVATESLARGAAGAGGSTGRPGHDPCLDPRPGPSWPYDRDADGEPA